MLVLMTSGIAAATPVFSNNSFETFSGNVTPPFTGLYDDVTLNDWNASNNYNRLDVFSSTGYNGSDRNIALRVHPGIDGAQQTVSGFTLYQVYDLIFDMAPSAVWNSNTSTWNNASSAGQGVKVFINDSLIGQATTNSDFSATSIFGSNPFQYDTYRLTFTALNTELTFCFDILDGNASGGVALDNIRLASGVPEPSSLVLLAIGLLVAAVAAYRSRWDRVS